MDNPKCQFLSIIHSVQETVVSEEIMHNLDTCEVTVVGDELDGEHESLEVDMAQLQQQGLEMSSSNLGLVITGTERRAVRTSTKQWFLGAFDNVMIALQKTTVLHKKSILFNAESSHRKQMRICSYMSCTCAPE